MIISEEAVFLGPGLRRDDDHLLLSSRFFTSSA